MYIYCTSKRSVSRCYIARPCGNCGLTNNSELEWSRHCATVIRDFNGVFASVISFSFFQMEDINITWIILHHTAEYINSFMISVSVLVHICVVCSCWKCCGTRITLLLFAQQHYWWKMMKICDDDTGQIWLF